MRRTSKSLISKTIIVLKKTYQFLLNSKISFVNAFIMTFNAAKCKRCIFSRVLLGRVKSIALPHKCLITMLLLCCMTIK